MKRNVKIEWTEIKTASNLKKIEFEKSVECYRMVVLFQLPL
jgi:hypothetical protein